MTDDDLITQYIEQDSRRPGIDRAHLKDSGVSVWALISYLKQAARDDLGRVAADYDVPLEAVQAALAYYNRHPAAIDTRIATNTVGASDRLNAA